MVQEVVLCLTHYVEQAADRTHEFAEAIAATALLDWTR